MGLASNRESSLGEALELASGGTCHLYSDTSIFTVREAPLIAQDIEVPDSCVKTMCNV